MIYIKYYYQETRPSFFFFFLRPGLYHHPLSNQRESRRLLGIVNETALTKEAIQVSAL